MSSMWEVQIDGMCFEEFKSMTTVKKNVWKIHVGFTLLGQDIRMEIDFPVLSTLNF